MNRNILLISLQQDLDVMGLRSLHSQILDHGFVSHILFIPRFSKSAVSDALVRFVDTLSPLFVGISLMSNEYERAKQMTLILKSRWAYMPVLWGGSHPTIAPETCLDYADFVCIGEGETFILDFANAIACGTDVESIGSLYFRKDREAIKNPLHPLITDLSSLPSCDLIPRNSYVLHKGGVTALNSTLLRKYDRYSGVAYSILSSRGCPFSCTYCCNNAFAKLHGSRQIRYRDSYEIIAELKKAIIQYPFIECINFQDDCFLSRNNEDMERFCHIYEKEIDLPFIARSIPVFVNERKMEMLKSAGLAWISLGLQSGSDRVCKEIYKRQSFKCQFLEAAKTVKKQNLAAIYDVILDNPFETDEDRLETVLTLMETPKPYYTQFFSLTFYPGTELRVRAIDSGFIKGHEYQTQDYHIYAHTSINNLVRLATFIPYRWMRFLVALYRQNPNSIWIKLNIVLARIFAITITEPLTYLRVIKLSQRNKLGPTIRVIPFYIQEGLSRFLKQFKKS